MKLKNLRISSLDGLDRRYCSITLSEGMGLFLLQSWHRHVVLADSTSKNKDESDGGKSGSENGLPEATHSARSDERVSSSTTAKFSPHRENCVAGGGGVRSLQNSSDSSS